MPGVSDQIDFEAFLSKEAKERKPSALRSMVNLFHVPDMTWLAGGLPTTSVFPFKEFSGTLHDGTKVTIDVDGAISAQQYSLTLRGHPGLLKWVEQHVRDVHKPPYPHEQLMTAGSTYATDLVFRLLLNPEDSVLAPEYSYPTFFTTVKPLGVRVVGVPCSPSGGGLCAPALRAALETEKREGRPTPKVLYLVTSGVNPTGETLSEACMREIYQIACEYNFLIVEDDPYIYLEFPCAEKWAGEAPGLRLGTSFLSLDTHGRVIRLDTFSKFVAPGFRVGWISACPTLLEKLTEATQVSTQMPSGISQILLHQLLEGWGSEGLDKHLKILQVEYHRRFNILQAALKEHISDDIATWDPPSGGMFMWIKVHCGVENTEDLTPAMMEAKVAVVPGTKFHYCGKPSPYVRLCFSTASDEDLRKGAKRFADALVCQSKNKRARLC